MSTHKNVCNNAINRKNFSYCRTINILAPRSNGTRCGNIICEAHSMQNQPRNRSIETNEEYSRQNGKMQQRQSNSTAFTRLQIVNKIPIKPLGFL